MNSRDYLAIIGSGASAIYVLKHLLDHVEVISQQLSGIMIFEKTSVMGMGMPYSPLNADRYHMSNISSKELPELQDSFAQWLREQEVPLLRSLGIQDEPITESGIYSRLALGKYLNSQYLAIIASLRAAGIVVHERAECEVTDIVESMSNGTFNLTTRDGPIENIQRVIIATGHRWTDPDRPTSGYYASPWPISKLLPAEGDYYNFEIGTLGASLSAFDVVASLAHRHGKFYKDDKKWFFLPHPGAEYFKIIMHSANGMLPHLEFAQVNPIRKIYRHIDREGMLALVDQRGFLRLEHFYDQVCRPALRDAFQKDGQGEMVAMLSDFSYDLNSFVTTMSAEHDYENAFEGMRLEMAEAEESVKNDHPVHWKEVVDDLFYTLNFHCELMPAEDHFTLKSVVMPFLMNVVAAMPLNFAKTILALYDANKLDMIPGNVTVHEAQTEQGKTSIEVDHNGEHSTASYRMFIDCTGQKVLEIDEYPFPTLVEHGTVRKARTLFVEPANAEHLSDEKQNHLFQEATYSGFFTGGVDIDSTYHLVRQNGRPHPKLYDIAFPHTSGVRPYSYGLQACSAAGEIIVRNWVEQISRYLPGPPYRKPRLRTASINERSAASG